MIIVRKMAKRDITVPVAEVHSIRRGMKLPPISGTGRNLPRKNVKMARQLILENPNLNEKEISAMLTRLGLPVSHMVIYRLRNEMKESLTTSKESAALPEAPKMSRPERIELWTTILKSHRTPQERSEGLEKLNEALSSLDKALLRDLDIEKRISLLEKRAEIKDMLKILKSLIEKDSKR